MSFPYELNNEEAKAFGLIVLQADETIEGEFRQLFPADVPLFVSRIPSGTELTPESIADMEANLPAAAALLPAGRAYAAIGYACTSGTTLIGVERVRDLVRGQCEVETVCDPLSSAFEALRSLDVRKIGLVSPYIPSVSAPVAQTFEEAGFDVLSMVHFGEEVEANVARISGPSITAAAKAVADGADAVFLSCTNLKTLDEIAALETALRLPVVSSNSALAWNIARAAGHRQKGPGRLFEEAP